MADGARRRVALVAALAVLALAWGGAAWIGLRLWRAPPADSLAARLAAVQPLDAAAPDCGAWLNGRVPAVLLVLGQSNAGNHGGRPVPGVGPAMPAVVPVIHDGRCVLAADPLPGGTGQGASLWPRVHAGLGGQWQGRPLVLAVVAVDGSRIADWVEADGPLRAHWTRQLTALRTLGWPIVAVAWQQGEADARLGTPSATYLSQWQQLRRLLQAQGVDAPWWLARSTYCPPGDGAAVRAAQLQAAQGAPGQVHLGPDTDALEPRWREGCHFSAEGVPRAAAGWVDALAATAR